MLRRCINFLTSLRLTVACLGLAIILVFVGTLAEVRMGLYQAQTEIFRSFFIHRTLPGTHWSIPVFPGGWLIGLALLVNLVAAHIKRFRFERKKTGILLIHAGLILLLLGQFLTELFQVESQMLLDVGGAKNYTEDSRKHELAVMDVSNPGFDQVVPIPESLLVPGTLIHPPGLPFSLRVKQYFKNSQPAIPMDPGEKLKASQGIGQRLLLASAPDVKTMDDEDKPAALIEVIANNASLGDWTESLWFTKPQPVLILRQWLAEVEQQAGVNLGVTPEVPQTFSLAGHTYQMALRMTRYYKPYTITLLEFRRDLYPGTDIPNNFSSKIHLSDPARGEDRDVLIRMNTPLRYRGETFYQAGFLQGDRASILQVVRNPAAVTPYLACSLVALGLVVQFLSHLFAFAKRQAQKAGAASPPGIPTAAILKPALAAKRRGV
ncbi:MAG: cytochrome c biogenesis protein ResB [Verrucomicrobiota bacterium]